jgi:hypothetical protein
VVCGADSKCWYYRRGVGALLSRVFTTSQGGEVHYFCRAAMLCAAFLTEMRKYYGRHATQQGMLRRNAILALTIPHDIHDIRAGLDGCRRVVETVVENARAIRQRHGCDVIKPRRGSPRIAAKFQMDDAVQTVRV